MLGHVDCINNISFCQLMVCMSENSIHLSLAPKNRMSDVHHELDIDCNPSQEIQTMEVY
jgi:hypothetical protein